mgnify:CR=1 FL=1
METAPKHRESWKEFLKRKQINFTVQTYFIDALGAMAQGLFCSLLIGTIMRFPQGSGTTAMITGSAIIAPMLVTLGINPYLAGLAVCLTAMCPSFLNDSYFHVVTSFSGMDIKTSLKTWTIGSILVPVFGSVIICILSLFIH